MKIRIATRKSLLARVQAEWVAGELRARGGHDCEFHYVSTEGDRDQNRTLSETSTPGVFTREVEAALLRGDADVAVHSLKDLPIESRPGLLLAAIPEREDPRDLFLPVKSTAAQTLADLPRGGRIATSSPRRASLLVAARRGIQIIPIRGNVETRLRKVDDGLADATLLASAGLHRLGIERPHAALPLADFPAAPAQGALGIQARNEEIAAALGVLDHALTRRAVEAERRVLASLGGGCHLALGATAWCEPDETWHISAFADIDARVRRHRQRGPELDELVHATITALR